MHYVNSNRRNTGSRNYRTVFIGLILVGLILTGGFATSSALAYNDDNRACLQDAREFCRGVVPGNGRILHCLAANEPNLSGACRHSLRKVKHHIVKFARACARDVIDYCPGVRPGQGRILRCLQRNRDRLTRRCHQITSNFGY